MNRDARTRGGAHLVFANHQATYGGGERVLIEQIAALADWPVEISLVFEKFPEHRDIEAELRARNPHFRRLLYLANPWLCMAWLLTQRPTGVVVCSNRPFLAAMRRLARLGRRFTAATTQHEAYPNVLQQYWRSRHLIDHWMLCYDFGAQFRQRYTTGQAWVIPPVFPAQAPVTWGPAERARARGQLGLPAAAFVVGYVGRMGLNKDPWATIAIAEQLQQHLSVPVHVLLAGQEFDGVPERLSAAINRSPLRARIHRHGKSPDNRPAFQALDLFVLPSWQEGFFPLSLIEAMERGVPVLATTVGGISSVLRDGDGGFLIPKAEDRQPLSAEQISGAPRPLLPYLAEPARWEELRHRAVARMQALRAGANPHAQYRQVFARLLPPGLFRQPPRHGDTEARSAKGAFH